MIGFARRVECWDATGLTERWGPRRTLLVTIAADGALRAAAEQAGVRPDGMVAAAVRAVQTHDTAPGLTREQLSEDVQRMTFNLAAGVAVAVCASRTPSGIVLSTEKEARRKRSPLITIGDLAVAAPGSRQ